MEPIQSAHAKLLARDLLAVTARPSSSSVPPSFRARGGRPVSRVEAVGVVVSRDRRDKFLRFLLDDGTGCVPCVLWLNHHLLLSRPPGGGAATAAAPPVPRHLAGRGPSEIEMLGRFAEGHAERAQLGALVRVQGRVTVYRGSVQLTVEGVVAERDPNAEAVHWLQCIRLARRCYGMLPPPPPPAAPVFHPAAPTSSATGSKRKAPINPCYPSG